MPFSSSVRTALDEARGAGAAYADVRVSRHWFEAVSTRYVRLHVLKNSANEAVHVTELKVYARGKSPEGLKLDS